MHVVKYRYKNNMKYILILFLVQKEEVLLVQTSPSSFGGDSGASHSDSRSITLMHRVSALEKHVEDIQAKLFLCKQDTKSLSSGRGIYYILNFKLLE